MTARHPWLLTGPWYRWQEPRGPSQGRASAPALQAFASPTFIDDFMREPQRSLVYRDEDRVAGVRKLFLATHRRFYIVACELHCDAPGLPAVARQQVCEAGFVIRRHNAYFNGWIPDPDRPGTGTWSHVDETPDTRCDEQIHRLFPLVPPPGDVRHSASGCTLFFGAIPDGSADTNANGFPRFATGINYEIRCFVRRHREGCPRRSPAPDCHGVLVWSRPSEPYRLAAPSDSTGVGHNPKMILDEYDKNAKALKELLDVIPKVNITFTPSQSSAPEYHEILEVPNS
jgi:hypothetical protein